MPNLGSAQTRIDREIVASISVIRYAGAFRDCLREDHRQNEKESPPTTLPCRLKRMEKPRITWTIDPATQFAASGL